MSSAEAGHVELWLTMELSRPIFDELAQVIHRLTGLVMGKDKGYLVRHRLEPVARSFGCESFEHFLRELKGGTGVRLHEAIIEAITTKETSFFRDHWFFDVLAARVLPDCAAAMKSTGGRRHRIRIWSAAASTGQEAWSLAMLAREIAQQPDACLRERQVEIMGSDISAAAVETARAGLYLPSETKRGISETRLKMHFHRVRTAHADRWKIDPSLQPLVTFRRADLLNLPRDIGTFDLILCRNVLIYFDQQTRERVCAALTAALGPGGWLALGSAESLYGINTPLQTIQHGRAVLYRKPMT